MQNFSLENHHIMNARQPFCWWMTFTKVSNPFLPHPLNGWHDHGWFYWFSLYWKNFSQTSLELEIFFPTYNGVRFFFSIVRHKRYFFQCRIFFSTEFICMLSSFQNQYDIFSKTPITPSKVKWSALKVYQTFGQLTDSDLSIISKAFESIGDKTLWGRGQEFVSNYPYPESPYGDVMTKFSWMDSLPNFITRGAPLHAPRARRLRYNT